MEECVFCRIIAGEVPASVVYEDDNVLAFLSIEAINTGHTLVIPKIHVEEFHELDEKTYGKLMAIVQKVAASLKRTYKPRRVGLMVQGFEVPHAHIHVVPLHEVTDVTSKKLLEHTALHPTPEALDAEAAAIQQNL